MIVLVLLLGLVLVAAALVGLAYGVIRLAALAFGRSPRGSVEPTASPRSPAPAQSSPVSSSPVAGADPPATAASRPAAEPTPMSRPTRAKGRTQKAAGVALPLQPLEDETRDRYASSWSALRRRAASAPAEVLRKAAAFVALLLDERGVPGATLPTPSGLVAPHARLVERYQSAQHVADELGRDEESVSEGDIEAAMDSFDAVVEQLLAAETIATR